MEKGQRVPLPLRLRRCLKLSGEEFLFSATTFRIKSSKGTLKLLVHAIPPSSPLASSLPSCLHQFIANAIISFRTDSHSSPLGFSDPPKRSRCRSSKYIPSKTEFISECDKLRAMVHVALLCLSHPKKPFLPRDILPAVQLLHDNLILFDSDSGLSYEIASLCEFYWKENFPGREMLISQSLPFLVSRSLMLKQKMHVRRVYVLREAFTLFDFEDESIEDMKLLLIRCIITPLYLKTDDGKKFLAFMFGLNMQLLKESLALVKSQIPFGRKSVLEAYGDVILKAWKAIEGDLKDEIENGFLREMVYGAIHAHSDTLAASIRRVLGAVVSQRICHEVEKLIFRLAEPVIFRSLQVANSSVRLNALHLLLDFFPLDDPDATKGDKDALLNKQLFLLGRLLTDECPAVRVVAVEGCFRVLHMFWEIIPSSAITKMLTNMLDEMSHDICSDVRLSTLKGVTFLLGNPLSHEILKVLVPRLGHQISDPAVSVRAAFVDLLLLASDIWAFPFNKVVSIEVLLSALAGDQSNVAQKITRLLVPTYFPSKVSVKEACRRCVALIKRSSRAGPRFCEFARCVGVPPVSLVELVRVLLDLALSKDTHLESDQLEGLLASAANLCNDIVGEPCHRDSLRELFANGKAKCLFCAAPTMSAQSSVLNIVSSVSPESMVDLVEECMHLISDCKGASENAEIQFKLRSAHVLLTYCQKFDGMLEALVVRLQEFACCCHASFGTEAAEQSINFRKRKRCKSRGRSGQSFEEQGYLCSVGIAWQIKDLLVLESSRRAILASPRLGDLFLALKVISETSILQCCCLEFVDASPLLAYAALALHMTVDKADKSKGKCPKQNGRVGSAESVPEHVLKETMDHLLKCGEKLFQGGDGSLSFKGRKSSSCRREKGMLNKLKMLTVVLKFAVDSIAMGYLAHEHPKCLTFTSSYFHHIILCLESHQSDCKLQLSDEQLTEIIVCLKSSFSYAAKLLNLILRVANESPPPPPPPPRPPLAPQVEEEEEEEKEEEEEEEEAFGLANGMLDLMGSVELCLGNGVAARLLSVAVSWVPDMILALGCAANSCTRALQHASLLHSPLWPSMLAEIELQEMATADQTEGQEDGENKSCPHETRQLPVFKRLIEAAMVLMKENRDMLSKFGAILLASSAVMLKRKEASLLLGLLHYVRVRLVGVEDAEWNGLDVMLDLLPEIYAQIEMQLGEEVDADTERKLCFARALLEPIWLYHVHETGQFCVPKE